jgi:hypothetical protein
MKVARVYPIFKKNSRLDVGNYRPVSILIIIFKILEKNCLFTTWEIPIRKSVTLWNSVRIYIILFDGYMFDTSAWPY